MLTQPPSLNFVPLTAIQDMKARIQEAAAASASASASMPREPTSAHNPHHNPHNHHPHRNPPRSARPLRGIVIDLRGNLGGTLPSALDAASLFLPAGTTQS